MLDQNISEINHNASAWTPAMKYGVIWGLIGVAIVLFQYLSGSLEAAFTGEASAITYLTGAAGLIIAVFCIYKSIDDHKTDRGGQISFGKAVGVGLRTSLIYGLITAVWTFVFYTFVFSGYADMMQEMMYNTYQEAGLGEDEIETAMGMAGMFSSVPAMTAMVIPSALIMGGIISLIVAAIKKNV